MGILATDILIKTMIEGALADLRKNSWILEDIFADLAADPLSSQDYGYKEVEMAMEWFLGNKIDVYLSNRIDTPKFPCITVVRISSNEMTERDAIGDDGEMSEMEPNKVTKQIQMIGKQFTPAAYNRTKGLVTLPKGQTTAKMFVGQFFVSSKSGKAYMIRKVVDLEQFQIAENTNEDFTNAYIAPATSLWNLQKELTFLSESFAIGAHAQSDMNQAIWLRQVVQYLMLRYKEAYLERRGFELSTFTVGAIDINPHFQSAEQVFTCMMSLQGQVEANFIKYAAPKLQGAKVGIRIADGPKTPEQYAKFVAAQGWSMEADGETEGEDE